jgi:DNA-entry nuclease
MKIFHLPGCARIDIMREGTRQDYTGTRENLEAEGYAPCDLCNP